MGSQKLPDGFAGFQLCPQCSLNVIIQTFHWALNLFGKLPNSYNLTYRFVSLPKLENAGNTNCQLPHNVISQQTAG